MSYAELAAISNFSFLRGASHAQDLVLTALALGHCGLGLADHNTVAGVVRAFSALRDIREGGMMSPVRVRSGDSPGETKEAAPLALDEALKALLQARAQHFRLISGCRLCFTDATPDIIAYPKTRHGWGQLCRLLTAGNRRAPKGRCHLTLDDVAAHGADLAFILMPRSPHDPRLAPTLDTLKALAPSSLWLGAAMLRQGEDRKRLFHLQEQAAKASVPLIATNDVLYATPDCRPLQDVLTCIREKTTIERIGRRLEINAERHLKAEEEMRRLFADCHEAIDETTALLAQVGFNIGELSYDYPDEVVPPGHAPQSWLEELVRRHGAIRYPEGVPPKVQQLLADELRLIAKLDYARYFLTIHDIVAVAREKGILCQGRGSAANSAVCFVLGITSVDPNEHDLLFARFISEERREPPDIDVDFEHERREEIIQHIYDKYGRHRAGLAATVISYRPKSAIREVGKVFGLSDDVTAALSGTQWGSWGSDITRAQVVQAGLDPDNREIARAVDFARRIIGFPRHLSQHVGGFILARTRLDELVPIGNAAMKDRTFIEWDKDDIDALKLMKVDILALGMLTCIRKAFDLIEQHEKQRLGLADVPRDDKATYAMLCRGDSVGVFQVESRAQMNMLPRLKPREFYDLVIEVAIVRPGPIQGQMVHPYLRRRAGHESFSFPAPAPPHPQDELYQILKHTYGVPLFQEQAMKIAMVAAEFTDVEANQLRRAMATFRHVGTIHMFEALMVERMVRRGYERAFAQNCFEQIKGFGSYGFPESHAASFAKLVYISAWLKRHHPGIFACALLNAQPMGFYAPAQIVRDAREHGVPVLPADINFSCWDNTMEREGGQLALRLGFRQLEGIHELEAERLVALRGQGYTSPEDLSARARLYGRPMKALADADAFRSLGLDRRAALWDIRRLPQAEPLPLFAARDAPELRPEADKALPQMRLGEHVVLDYQTTRLSLKTHPMALLRPVLSREGVVSAETLTSLRDGTTASVTGLVLVRQRPGKGNAVFITLEDETGIANIVLWARKLDTFRREVMGARLMQVYGRLQKSPEGVTHLMAETITDRSELLSHLTSLSGAQAIIPKPLHLAPPSRQGHPRNARVLPRSRDFH